MSAEFLPDLSLYSTVKSTEPLENSQVEITPVYIEIYVDTQPLFFPELGTLSQGAVESLDKFIAERLNKAAVFSAEDNERIKILSLKLSRPYPSDVLQNGPLCYDGGLG